MLAKVQHQSEPIAPYPGLRSAGGRREPSFAFEIAARAAAVTASAEGGAVRLGDYAVPGFGADDMLVNFDRTSRRFRKMFGLYLAPSVVDMFAASGAMPKLGGERRTMAFLFTDVAGFTTLCEEVEPELLAAALNEYLDGVCEIIMEHGGLVNEFIGDAVLAIFGAPNGGDRPALRADQDRRSFRRDYRRELRVSPPTQIFRPGGCGKHRIPVRRPEQALRHPDHRIGGCAGEFRPLRLPAAGRDRPEGPSATAVGVRSARSRAGGDVLYGALPGSVRLDETRGSRRCTAAIGPRA